MAVNEIIRPLSEGEKREIKEIGTKNLRERIYKYISEVQQRRLQVERKPFCMRCARLIVDEDFNKINDMDAAKKIIKKFEDDDYYKLLSITEDQEKMRSSFGDLKEQTMVVPSKKVLVYQCKPFEGTNSHRVSISLSFDEFKEWENARKESPKHKEKGASSRDAVI